MKQTLSPQEAADLIGTSADTIRKWIRRADYPLPSVAVGASGRNRRVILVEIQPWLTAESLRAGGVGR